MEKEALFKLSYGVFVLTAKQNEKDNGCIINTAIQAASEPNQLCISVNNSNYTTELIKSTGKFTVSVLSEEASFDLFKRFGFQSGRDVNKFADFTGMERGENGLYYITEGTNAFFEVEVTKTEDLGSHTLFVGTITNMKVLSEVQSATYDYYRNHIKQNPSTTTSSTETTSSNGKTVWRCSVCGYEYEGEELPEDFICPWCKHPADDFEKVVVN